LKKDLRSRLLNWGIWLEYDSQHGPDHPRCVSIESQHIPEADEVWESNKIYAVPNTTDAENLDKLMATLFQQGKLGINDRYCLAIRYGGYGAVIKIRKIGDHAMKHLADNAEIILTQELDN
jgi:hypothetical protein